MVKCEICDEEAVCGFSPDMDIEGLGACEKHRDDVRLAYYILFQEGEREYKEYIENLKNKQNR